MSGKIKHVYVLDPRWKKIYHGILNDDESIRNYLLRNHLNPKYCEYIVTDLPMYLEELEE